MLIWSNRWFNSGPPINVPASGGSINLDKVIEHYKQVNEDVVKERERIDEYYKNKESA